MSQAPDHGPAVANPDVADQRYGVGDRRAAVEHFLVALDLALAAQRADHQSLAIQPVVGERRYPVEVDDRLGARQPEVEHGHQALAAGQDPPVLA